MLVLIPYTIYHIPYIRYRETIAAAVQCFFKVVEISPHNAIAWGLLGRCYMATNQYTDAWEAYNK
ncbi:tetratricopeptide repeat protein [archaeon]|nr:MAG: tetratricopeptide repeat protein [archaeon]